MKQKKVTILVVDDDDLDRRAIKRAFKEQKLSNPIIEAKNGREALEILRGSSGDGPLKKPYLILLDLNMPIMNGHEFLEEMRDDPQLEKSIVFVLSTSDDEQDKCKAYQKHIAGYMLKKHIVSDFMNNIKMLDLFVLSVEFPGN